ncbi:MAG TPA: hypothetical protein VFC56_15265 [Stellaceae bacterium]|nr:hypothetical protein [Stellaceae bacterium]
MGEDLRRSARRLSGRQPQDPVFVVHSLAHAVAALTAAVGAGRPIILVSAPDAGIYAGSGWFKALVGAAREAVPHAEFTAILDCGDDAGAAQGAIRAGVDEVIYTGRADVAERLAAIAVAGGHRLSTQRPVAALDLGQWFFADGETLRRHCADRLASLPAIC